MSLSVAQRKIEKMKNDLKEKKTALMSMVFSRRSEAVDYINKEFGAPYGKIFRQCQSTEYKGGCVFKLVCTSCNNFEIVFRKTTKKNTLQGKFLIIQIRFSISILTVHDSDLVILIVVFQNFAQGLKWLKLLNLITRMFLKTMSP